MANALSAQAPLMGDGDAGIKGIAAKMGVGKGVLDGVLAGLKEYQGTIKGFKDQMPTVRMANPNIATPNFMSPGVASGAAKGAAGVSGMTPPPAAPNLNLPTSVPAGRAGPGRPLPGARAAEVVEAGNTPPDQMDDTGNDLPQQPPEEPGPEHDEDEEEGQGGGGGVSFRAPRGHGKKKPPNRAQRAMGASAGFKAPLGRAA